MNRQQRRAQARRRGKDAGEGAMVEEGQFITMPLGEFAQMFDLDQREIVEEGISGRLLVHGYRNATGFDHVAITHDAIVAWLAHKNLPPAIREKTQGGFDKLDRWLHDFKKSCRVEIDPDTDDIALVLPNGTRLTNIFVRGIPRH